VVISKVEGQEEFEYSVESKAVEIEKENPRT
jgi:copper chaperone CopZ